MKDPAFQPDAPRAYLDLDDNNELGGKITGVGQYQFEIKAMNRDAVVAHLPIVTASLGVHLQSLPAIDFTSPNLTWTAVANASEYRISFNGANADTVNGSAVSYNVSAKLTTPPQDHYDVWVGARYFDSAGNPAEIARGIGGFDY